VDSKQNIKIPDRSLSKISYGCVCAPSAVTSYLYLGWMNISVCITNVRIVAWR